MAGRRVNSTNAQMRPTMLGPKMEFVPIARDQSAHFAALVLVRENKSGD